MRRFSKMSRMMIKDEKVVGTRLITDITFDKTQKGSAQLRSFRLAPAVMISQKSPRGPVKDKWPKVNDAWSNIVSVTHLGKTDRNCRGSDARARNCPIRFRLSSSDALQPQRSTKASGLSPKRRGIADFQDGLVHEDGVQPCTLSCRGAMC